MKFFKKTDLIVIFLIVIISMVSWIIYNSVFSKKTAKAEIYYNNSLVKTVDLNTGTDKICIKTGKIKTVQ